eukprot:15482274-Alexandrium_andersonii.AAC.1
MGHCTSLRLEALRWFRSRARGRRKCHFGRGGVSSSMPPIRPIRSPIRSSIRSPIRSLVRSPSR